MYVKLNLVVDNTENNTGITILEIKKTALRGRNNGVLVKHKQYRRNVLLTGTMMSTHVTVVIFTFCDLGIKIGFVR